jgi:CheY-like chemotaxis protein
VRILVVEDNEANASLMVRRLARLGHEVSVAATGEEGVEMAASAGPDVILMDMTLPGIDGLEATRRIKASPASWTVPVIALTGLAFEEDRRRALEAGCDAFLAKPLDFPELVAHLEVLAADEDVA